MVYVEVWGVCSANNTDREEAMRSSSDRGPATTPEAECRPGQTESRAPARGRRRSFTAEYKLEVLSAYDAAEPGEKSEILRREGLYSSHIVDWRRTRDAGAFAALTRPRGRPAADPKDAQIAQLRKERTKLERELVAAHFVAAVQTKTAVALGDALRANGHRFLADTTIDEAIGVLVPHIGTRAACAVVGESQASYYRRHCVGSPDRRGRIPSSGKAAGRAEREEIAGPPGRERPRSQAPAPRLTPRRPTVQAPRTSQLSKNFPPASSSG
jgi:transposase